MINNTLSEHDFQRLSQFIHREFGIKMPPIKKVLLESRLQKRLRLLGLNSFTEYIDFLFSPEGKAQEMIPFINKVTTNKTEFFREAGHFDYMTRTAIPDLVQQHGSRKSLKVWSAGCSSGEEPYTLAMVLSEFHSRNQAVISGFSILATDISMEVLEIAHRAVYSPDRVVGIPLDFKHKYFMKSKNPAKPNLRVVPELRRLITFGRLNFMDGDYGLKERYDIIFCRNVIIYFDRPTQEKIFHKFCRNLNDGGYVFVGHSETLHGMDVPLVQVSPTIYKKK
ncbi:MAG: chemotaxis protein CheR [SAR324 cluster bacterium]|nr:chemotaxis protein CheR [SAR324 cluster bacterium]